MYGFIGVGKMGSSIIESLLALNNIDPREIVVYDLDIRAIDKLKEKHANIQVISQLNDFLNHSFLKTLFLCVKPQQAKDICVQLGSKIKNPLVLISILAGVKIFTLQQYLNNEKIAVIRMMPNIATLIGKGCGGIVFSKNITFEQEKTIYDLLNQIGYYLKVPESKMDAITALSGSGPGFVYTFIEALIDSGVAIGLTRVEARILVLQTILGATELMIKENKHPAELRDWVTSPAGTTIKGVKELEKNNFRNALISAVEKAYHRSLELGKE